MTSSLKGWGQKMTSDYMMTWGGIMIVTIIIIILVILIFAITIKAHHTTSSSSSSSSHFILQIISQLVLFLWLIWQWRRNRSEWNHSDRWSGSDDQKILEIIQGGFFLTVPPNFQYQNEKQMGSQSEVLFHEIPDVQKILVGWTTFFFLALKFGRNS